MRVVALLVAFVVFVSVVTVYSRASDDVVTTADVVNATPVVETIDISTQAFGADDLTTTGILPNVGTDRTIHINGIVSDASGIDDIATTSLVFFRASASSTCAVDKNDCYRVAVCDMATTTSPTELAYNCPVAVAYWVDATDAAGRFPDEAWTALVTVSDTVPAMGTSTKQIEMNALLALNIPESVDYGEHSLGDETTVSTNQEMILTQRGNTRADVELSGTEMTCSVLGGIPVSRQRWSLVDEGYTAATHNLSAIATAASRNIGYREDETNELTSSLFWNIGIPASGVKGICAGSNTVSIVAVPNGDEGSLLDGRLSNVAYTSTSHSGRTTAQGGFTFSPNETITFSIGAVTIGSFDTNSMPIDNKVFLQDLFGLARTNVTDAKLIRVGRFLQSIATSESSTSTLAIPESAHTALTGTINFANATDGELQTKVESVYPTRTLHTAAAAELHIVNTLVSEAVASFSVPVLSSSTATSIASTSVTLGGTVTSTGGLTITERGTCWGDSATSTPNCLAATGTVGTFTHARTGLQPGTVVYYRAYARNILGTGYSSIASFTTTALLAPTVASPTATSISYAGATFGGTVTSDGGNAIIDRGTCWGTASNALTNCVSASSTSATFTHVVTLPQSTTIYYKAYAYNSIGTGYSSVASFTTPTFSCGASTVVYQGVTYTTVAQGTQCWLGQNISHGTMLASASTMPTNNSTVEKWCWGGSSTNCTADGGLYSWDEAMGYSTAAGAQGICPSGWHIPTDTEWKTMEMFLGMIQGAADSTGFRGTDQGTQIKSGGSSGINMLLAGDRRIINDYYGRGSNAYIWTSTQSSANAYARGLYSGFSTVDRFADSKNYGFTVRCLSNTALTTSAPTVTGQNYDNLVYSTVTLGANVSSDGGMPVTARGTCWGITTGSITNCLAATGTVGAFTQNRTGLPLNESIFYRGYATNAIGTGYSSVGVFFTDPPALPDVTDATAVSVAYTTATLGGTVLSDGGLTITARGVCWGTTANPTTNCTSTSGTTGTFTYARTGLPAGTTIHYRAYATNSLGTAYSSDATFITQTFTVPTLTSPTAVNILETTATLGGTVSSDGGSTITARGTCWGTSANPTGNCTSTSGTTGTFTQNRTGLPSGTLIHYRAYAVNTTGTGYSSDATFTTRVPNIWVNANSVEIYSGNMGQHSFAIVDGALYAWGLNTSGQLGLGDTTNRISPTRVGTDTNWASISAGDTHTMGIKTDGTLWVWGNGATGRLGLGSDTSDRLSPVQFGVSTNWAQASAGGFHSMALKTDGSLYAWGNNANGRLGLGNTTDRVSPVRVGTANDWVQVSAGRSHTLARKSDGSLYAWGWNADGQLGLGDTTDRLSPVRIGTGTDWAYVSAGGFHTHARKTNGSLWGWGNNGNGRLGIGNTTDKLTPTQVGSGTDWGVVSAGRYNTVAAKTDGTLWAMGYGFYGQNGNGSTADALSPVQEFGARNGWENAIAGQFHVLGRTADGQIYGWGNGSSGQTGLGDTAQYTFPVQIPSP